MAEITWTPLAVELPPQRSVVLLAGPSGTRRFSFFVALGYYDESFRPSHGGPARWLDITNQPLSDSGWTPTHWAPPPEPPTEAT